MSFVFLIAMISMAAFFGRAARASLGGGEDSVEQDRVAISASPAENRIFEQYTIHEMRLGQTTIREFASPSGVVFGIAWTGLAPPDRAGLRRFLGSYADDYESAMRQGHREHGHKPRTIRGDRIVVETWGHMRKLHGRVYDPSLIPPGTSVYEMR